MLTMTYSTITGNQMGSGGNGMLGDGSAGSGAGLVNASGGDAIITATTISQNITDSFGGGIYNAAVILLTSCTITRNTSNSAGGGVFNGGNLDMTHTIIAQ
jgi:hypothetical protein